MRTTRTLSLILIAWVSGVLPSPLEAQTPLAWEDCVREASLHNRDLLSAKKSLKAAEDSHMASLGQFFPQVNFNASVSRSGPGGVSDALNGPLYDQGARLSLNATQDIFSFDDFASADQSGARLDLARAQLTQAKAQLSHDLKVDFYQLLYSQRQIALLESIVDRQKENMNLVEMNFKGGTDNKGSFLQAQAAYQQAVFELDQARRNLRVSQRQLGQVLGRDPMGDIEVAGEFASPETTPQPPDFRALTLRTPAHLEAVAQLHLAEGQYVSARGAFFPTLSANASLSRNGWNFGDTQPAWSAGLQLSLPLFTGGKDLFNFKSAEESKTGAQYDLKSTDLKTESSLENAFASYADSVEQIGVFKSQLTAAQTQEEIAKAQYLNGLMIFVNWNQIETELTNQEKAELSGLLNEKTQEANWELAQGKGVMP